MIEWLPYLAILLAAVLALVFAVAGGWWFFGMCVAYVVATAIDEVTA